MNGHAKNGDDESDLAVDPYPLPLAWRRLKPANDNREPLLRRLLRLGWAVTVIVAFGWVLWTGLR